MKIVIDDKIPYIKSVFNNVAETVFLPGSEISNAVLCDADALIIRTRTKCNKNLLQGSSVKFIATATIGYDHIDTEYCKSTGIKWSNAPGCNAYSVQQYVISALLNLFPNSVEELPKRTIGIIGLGNVGRKIYDMSTAFGMKILINDPPLLDASEDPQKIKEQYAGGQFVEFDKLVRESDIITFHTPLIMSGNYKTYHLGNEKFFSMLKSDAIIINTSRGEVVDNQLLKKNLKNNRICNAVLDVWEHEPQFDKELLKLVHFGTPHIAGYSADGKAKGTAMSVQALSRFFGFGLERWSPDNIPGPSRQIIEATDSDISISETLQNIYNCSYNINDDDIMLRNHINEFENLRGNYPLRREPPAYTVRIPRVLSDNHLRKILKSIKFNIEIS
jgi:erythronate-4-phosphate dehydrogenase